MHQSDVKIQTPYEINAEGMRMSRVYDDVINQYKSSVLWHGLTKYMTKGEVTRVNKSIKMARLLPHTTLTLQAVKTRPQHSQYALFSALRSVRI